MKQFPRDLSELGNGYITMKMVDAIYRIELLSTRLIKSRLFQTIEF